VSRDERVNQIDAEINHLRNLIRHMRTREKSVDAKRTYLSQPGTVPASNVKGLRSALQGLLPTHMMPGNVGGINEVTWPFYFQINIDFGDDPTIIDTNVERGFFQVDQEAAFLLMSVGYSCGTDDNGLSACSLAPLQLDIIDRQSSRRFSNSEIPMQAFGSNSQMSIFPVAMYFQPNAFLDISVRGMNTVGQDFEGSGLIQFSFFGYRIRSEDADKVLSTIFQSQY
jgi:hypothetical protein